MTGRHKWPPRFKDRPQTQERFITHVRVTLSTPTPYSAPGARVIVARDEEGKPTAYRPALDVLNEKIAELFEDEDEDVELFFAADYGVRGLVDPNAATPQTRRPRRVRVEGDSGAGFSFPPLSTSHKPFGS